MTKTKLDLFKMSLSKCVWSKEAHKAAPKCFASWLPALMVTLVTRLPVKALHVDHKTTTKGTFK